MLAALLVVRGLWLLEKSDNAGVEGPFPCLRQALGSRTCIQTILARHRAGKTNEEHSHASAFLFSQ